MSHPTESQLREYAEQLPDIYPSILKAFPILQPNRRLGDGLTEDTIMDAFSAPEAEAIFPTEEITDALNQLVAKGFLQIPPVFRSGFRFFSPTPLGEQLIGVLTGTMARAKGAPPLPEPTWG